MDDFMKTKKHHKNNDQHDHDENKRRHRDRFDNELKYKHREDCSDSSYKRLKNKRSNEFSTYSLNDHDRTLYEDRYRNYESARNYREAYDSTSKKSYQRRRSASRSNPYEQFDSALLSTHCKSGRNHYDNSKKNEYRVDRHSDSDFWGENDRSSGVSSYANNEYGGSEKCSSSSHHDNKPREKKIISSTVVSSAVFHPHEPSQTHNVLSTSSVRHENGQYHKIAHASRTSVLSTSHKITNDSNIRPSRVEGVQSQCDLHRGQISMVLTNSVNSTTSVAVKYSDDPEGPTNRKGNESQKTSDSKDSNQSIANESVTKFLKEFLNPDNLRALADLMEASNFTELRKTLEEGGSAENEKNIVSTSPKRGKETEREYEYSDTTLCEGIPADYVEAQEKIASTSDEPPTKRAKRHKKTPDWTYFSLNGVLRCPICNISTKSFVSHLLNDHPNSEILTSRLAPNVANSLRKSRKLQCKRIERKGPKKQNEYSQFCYFCNEVKCLERSRWVNHIAKHGGYYQYKCCNCSKKLFTDNAKHHKCQGKKVLETVPQPHFKNEILMAYICDLCDYVRFNESEIQKHLEYQHQVNETKRFIKAPFLKLPITRKKRKRVENVKEVENHSEVKDCAQARMDEVKLSALNKTQNVRVQLTRLRNPENIIQETVSKTATTAKCDSAPSEVSMEPRPSIKNNNPAFHCLMIRNQCQVCGEVVQRRSIVRHYVQSHPESEIFNSRLLPEVANFLRNRSPGLSFEIIVPQGTKKSTNRKIKQFCYFCNESRCHSKGTWIEHMANHSGYFLSKCIDCSKQFVRRNPKHLCKNEKNLEMIPQPHFQNKELSAFLCDQCNFVRFNKNEMEKHLILEHEEKVKGFKKILFLRLSTDEDLEGEDEELEGEDEELEGGDEELEGGDEELEGGDEENYNDSKIVVENTQGCLENSEGEDSTEPTQQNRNDFISTYTEYSMKGKQEDELEEQAEENCNEFEVIENTKEIMENNKEEEPPDLTVENRYDSELTENIQPMEVSNAEVSNETGAASSFAFPSSVSSPISCEESHEDYSDDDNWETCSDDSL